MKTTVTLCISVLVVIIISFPVAAQDAIINHSFQFDNLPLGAALDSLMKWYPQSLVYLDHDIEGKSVSCICSCAGFDQALSSVLSGTQLMWMRLGNQIIIKHQTNTQIQKYSTFSGTITDSITGEWIAGARVVLLDSTNPNNETILRWGITNTFGFFSLPRLPLGRYCFIVRAIGYETVKQNVNIISDGSIKSDICLVQKEIILKEVTIEGSRTALSSANGISHSVYIPSVPTDQNQYLLDGGRIFNPSHFGGVLSTFNNAALNDVQVELDGLPPDYGGRIGAILDLSMRDGTRQGLAGSLGIGSLSSECSIEGPIDGNTTFLFSCRGGYPDAAMQLYKPAVSPIHSGSYELVSKIANRLSGNQQISLSGYLGQDSYNNQIDSANSQLRNNFTWGNTMLDLRWIGIVSPSLFLYSSAVYSRYGFNLQHNLIENSNPYSGLPLSSNYYIEDISFHASAEDYYDESHIVRAGVEVVHHTINAAISEFSSQTANFSLQDFSAWEASVYLQDQWKLLPGILAEFGARATSFMNSNESFHAVDPRFSFLASLNEHTRLYCSFSTINEFLHPYRNSGVFTLYPTMFWYPSSGSVVPTTSLQMTLGIEKEFLDDAYTISAESYYRVTNNLHEFTFDTTINATESIYNTGLNGTGKNYGLVCVLQKRIGAFTGSLSYNLSWSFEDFAQLNNGKEFSPPFDRRHELQLTSQYSISENWTCGILCVITSPQSSSIVQTSALSQQLPGNTNSVGHANAVQLENDLVDINGSRLPGFQRLKLEISRQILIRNLSCHVSFSFLNSYGLIDPFTWTLQNSRYIGLMWNATLREVNLFPLYPALEIIVRF